MIGSISHGIKGLLTGLDGGIYLTDSGFEKENQKIVKEGWEIVKLMVDRIRKMVLDILFYAKKRDLKWEKADVLSFANDGNGQGKREKNIHPFLFLKRKQGHWPGAFHLRQNNKTARRRNKSNIRTRTGSIILHKNSQNTFGIS